MSSQLIKTPSLEAFCKLNWQNSNTIDSCFITSKEDFPENKRKGESYLNRFNFIKGEIIKTSEIIYKKVIDFDKFKNKKILVVGGGPTTNWHNWKSEEYDFIFSCNHFFLNKKVKNTKVAFCLLGNEVNHLRKEFVDYITENETIIGIEDYNNNPNNIKELQEKIKNPIFPYVLRFQGKIGVAPKLVVLATLLGARHVDFVGIDGRPKGVEVGETSHHSFQEGKKFSMPYSSNLSLVHYACLKFYLENKIGKGVVYRNLGKGHELNLSGEAF